jgi:hypothetical protein
MTKLRCVHCGARFIPAPQVPNQAYCSKANCQKERRRQWHKSKLQSDPDYRDNQSRAQKAWTDKNPDYWRQRRQDRPDYGNPLPSGQDSSAAQPRNPSIKMNSLNPPSILRQALQDGVFRLKVLAEPDGVKMDAWIVELSSIHAGSRPISRRIKR